MIVSTMNDLPGHDVREVLGDVFGLTVFVRGASSNIEAGLIEAATELGADAVLAMRFETSELRDIGSEICAYGTAVKVRAVGP
jgi:uncharacterized protein YbjQ (UPF0145 family)